MAIKKTATVTGSTRKFKNLQELADHLNSNGKIKVIGAGAGWAIGTEGFGATTNGYASYVNGSMVQAYVTLVKGSTTVVSYTWSLNQVGYADPITKLELEQDLVILEEQIRLVNVKLAYMKETGAEEFDENEFKVFNTLSILDEKKLSKLDKAKAIAALINNK